MAESHSKGIGRGAQFSSICCISMRTSGEAPKAFDPNERPLAWLAPDVPIQSLRLISRRHALLSM